jgi:ABC-type sulfate transport system permease component
MENLIPPLAALLTLLLPLVLAWVVVERAFRNQRHKKRVEPPKQHGRVF